MLADWLKENEYHSKRDTLMGVIYSLRIANREQMKVVTGWTDAQIRGTLERIRALEKGEKGSWLQYWQPKQRSPYVYTLGEKGIEHVRALQDNALGYEESEITRRGQINHFMGTNKVLIRALQQGLTVDNWYSTKEVMSYLFYQLRPVKSPVNPDAMIKLPHGTFFVEYDTGTENGGKLEGRMHRYMMLSVIVGQIFPVVWVAPKESRAQFIARKAGEAPATYLNKMDKEIKKRKLPAVLPKTMPLMYAFVEGEETAFLAGNRDATPILGKK